MLQGFGDRGVRIFQLCVLANQGNVHFLLEVVISEKQTLYEAIATEKLLEHTFLPSLATSA
jgi:hypothetical protein